MTQPGFAFAVAALSLLLMACGASGPAGTNRSGDPVGGDLTVFAAASLTGAFSQIGQDFMRAHPAAKVRFDFGGSSTLVTQILEGAPADLFASADQANMQKLVNANLADGAPSVFARNHLQIVVQAGNPRHLMTLADLARPDLVVVMCAPAVPCGTYAGQALSKLNVKVTPRSEEQDVKQVVTKVSLGEADAGIVYATDVRAGAPRVEGIDLPPDLNVVATYPIARVRGTRNDRAANAFMDWVLGARGRAVLVQAGFAPP